MVGNICKVALIYIFFTVRQGKAIGNKKLTIKATTTSNKKRKEGL
jgi:hypothetical protein